MSLDIWMRLKRHLALPLTLAAIVIIAIILIDVRGAKEQGTYSVQHLWGDSSVLEDTTISGVIVDGNHRTTFAWQGSEVSTETEVYPYLRSERKYMNDFNWRIRDYYYDVRVNIWGQEVSISRYEYSGMQIINRENAVASIPVRPIVYKENTVELTNRLEYGIASVGEEVFLTFVSTKGYKGTNGIYKLAFNRTDQYIAPREWLKSEPVITFELTSNEEEHSTGIEVLGLESVGDKLALIIVKDGSLVIEGYSTSGESLGEAKITPFDLSGRDSTAGNTVKHNESYEAYSNDATEMLNLSFLINDPKLQRTIISVDFSDGVKLADVTTTSMDSEKLIEERDYVHGQRHIAYQNGKLYYASLFHDIEENGASYVNLNTPRRFLLHVYEQGELVYKGELHTDINDDLIRIQNMQSFGYDSLEYRNIYEVRMN